MYKNNWGKAGGDYTVIQSGLASKKFTWHPHDQFGENYLKVSLSIVQHLGLGYSGIFFGLV